MRRFFSYRDSLISIGPLSHEVSEKEAIEIVKALPPPNLPTKVCAVLGAPPAQHTPSSESLPDPNKTSTAFWKPVYALVGIYIDAWQKERPPQPPALDRKTNELVDFLFSYRRGRIGDTYVNDFLIPFLCERAGVPLADTRGCITSHRARATIASLYYNCPEGDLPHIWGLLSL